MTSVPPAPASLRRGVPVIFVLIWSTGFVVARYGMPHAGPMGFLALRYLLSVLAFGAWIAWAGARWPQGRSQWLHLAVTGLLMHGGYLGGVWVAVKGGLGAGMAALIVGLQPVLTALWLSIMVGGAQRVRPLQWLGLGLGLAGLALVVGHKLDLGLASPANILPVMLALASITVGTLYQKRWVAPCDVRTASTVQLAAALAATAPLALIEPHAFDWHPELVAALAWSVLVLTLGGSSLLYMLIQRGAATAVTSLMYLVPPCTAVLAWWLFDEGLTALSLSGLACTAVGVALVVRDVPPAPRGPLA
ncbi:MAG: EamA family transporter [Leptothrix sp. (in: Bacteria)]|nr:EamA family transporter [Leptothrix sp. (in: b-proteobacteria)]